MIMAKNKNIWIFVDETGTLSLSDKKNPIFGLGLLVTKNPELVSDVLSKIKYQLWQDLFEIKKTNNETKIPDFFHAKNDPKPFKKSFYNELEKTHLKDTLFIFGLCKKDILRNHFASLASLNNQSELEILIMVYSIILHTLILKLDLEGNFERNFDQY
jgi:hypothetical protein